MRTVAIVQARVGSSRLPGKVLADIGNRSMLERVLERARAAQSLHSLLVATTLLEADEAIVQECSRLGVPVFRGRANDVLDRYYRAAAAADAEAIVRITADCPLIDPQIVDRVVDAFHSGRADYASNTLERTYPRGLDCEVIGRAALSRCWRDAVEPYQRQHVTPFIYQHPGEFMLISVEGSTDLSHHRWTVDTPADLRFVREVYSRLPEAGYHHDAVISILEREPELAAINRDVVQKPLEEG